MSPSETSQTKASAAAAARRPVNALPTGYQLGEYRIQSVLGHGGFGITYLAKDSRLGSLVAIKEYFPQAFAVRDSRSTIRPRPDGDPDDRENYRWGLQEFLKEARALAQFKHNYIVRVLRFLEANGTAYMVMEYEAGESLTSYLSKHGGLLSEPMLLKVFLPILSGLQAVHDAGLLHLDIKPDNIYLRANGKPMLIDFGSARQAKSMSDPQQKVALTPGYSAIEHYPGRGKQGPWTDTYSMGATLYRCITGQEPVDVVERHTTFKIRGYDPLRPATDFDRPHFAAHIRECVDNALRLDPEDRPKSAAVLQNGLMGKGLTEDARAEQSAYGSGFIGIIKTVSGANSTKRPNRSPLEKLIAFIVFAATLTIVIPKILVDTSRITEAELYEGIDSLKAKVAAIADGAGRFVDERIFGKKPAPKPTVARAHRPRPVRKKAIPPFEINKNLVRTITVRGLPIVSLAFLSDDAVLASASADGVVELWKTDTGMLVKTLAARAGHSTALAASPDGQLLALPGPDNTIRLWAAKDNKEAGRLPGHSDRINVMAFSADGKLLASAAQDKSVTLWDVENRKRIRNLAESKTNVVSLAFSSNGRLLAAGDSEGGIQYWEVPTTTELAYALAGSAVVTTLAFSPDGKWLASGGSDHQLRLWHIGIDRSDRVLSSTPDTVQALIFSPDKKWLIVAGTSDAIEMWNVESGEIVHELHGHNHDVYALALSRDGTLLASAGDDNTIRIWK